MSGLIFLAIMFYALSYISDKNKAKRAQRGGDAPARPQARVSPQPEDDAELSTHDEPEAFRPAEPFKEASSGSMNYVSTEGEGTESVECSLNGHAHPHVHANAHTNAHASAHPNAHPSAHPNAHPSAHPSAHASAHPDAHPSAHPESPDAEAHLPAEPVSRPFLSAADRDACKRAVIYAEILGKPRALRR